MQFQDTLIALYWAKAIPTDDPDACWGWSGAKDALGYGKISLQVNGKKTWKHLP